MKTSPTIALVGNPNCGKTTLFNKITGLNQKVGNFPGVTVDKKSARIKLENNPVNLLDLPGTYSIYPKAEDEQVVFEILANPDHPNHPNYCIIVVDASKPRRGLLLASQVLDLEIPSILVLNQMEGEVLPTEFLKKFEQQLGLRTYGLKARAKSEVEEFIKSLSFDSFQLGKASTVKWEDGYEDLLKELSENISAKNNYDLIQQSAGQHRFSKGPVNPDLKDKQEKILQEHNFHKARFEVRENLRRYKWIDSWLETAQQDSLQDSQAFSTKLDKVLTHKVWGIGIFLAILFLMFQAVFAWASYPMDWIDQAFGYLGSQVSEILPEGKINGLIVDGIIAGLAGVFVFVPQIAFLFLFVSILEESGYMARVSFMMDRFLRKFGLNGRSIVPLISGVACAVPAIMATRTIQNKRERLLTILVTPLMSCSARLPVYTLLIGLVIPSKTVAGIFNLQGLVLMAFYLLGFVAAIGLSWIFTFLIKSKERSFFVMEMPTYKWPDLSSVALTLVEKVKLFLLEAGKVILAISIVLWICSSYGPSSRMEAINMKYNALPSLTEQQQIDMASEKLENSFVGIFGKQIEPVISPLGFDWKIGIALITSFAAREVFVGSMATIYAVANPDDESSLRERMQSEMNPITNSPRYNLAVGMSLMLFYAFAMQCMSTLAVSFKETNGWKWPLVQFLYMTALAYLAALLAYQSLS